MVLQLSWLMSHMLYFRSYWYIHFTLVVHQDGAHKKNVILDHVMKMLYSFCYSQWLRLKSIKTVCVDCCSPMWALQVHCCQRKTKTA